MSDQDRAGEGGFRGIGLAIGAISTFYYTILAVLVVFSIWGLVSIYAIVKWAGDAPDEPNPVVLVVGTAMIVVLLTILFAAAVSLMGRAMNPKKRAH